LECERSASAPEQRSEPKRKKEWFITLITSIACLKHARNGLGEGQIKWHLTARRTAASSFAAVVDSSGVLYSHAG